jgi:RHS repeat-associated protein
VGAMRYFPYGEEQAPTGEGREKFGTYLRDGNGMDYADQRYYVPGAGRFLTADPAEADSESPLSWNRYTYVEGDPINYSDPEGDIKSCPSGTRTGPDGKSCVADGSEGSGRRAGGDGPRGRAKRVPVGDARREERGRGPSPPAATGDPVQGGLDKARERALEMLQSPECQSLFGTAESRANGFDPATLIAGLFSSTNGATVRAGTATITSVFGRMTSLGPLGLTVGPLPPGAVVDVAVLINTSTFGLDEWNDALTLLHELGHVYNAAPGAGGSPISKGLADFNGANDDLLVKDCLTKM